jgi:hypothetical protein
MLAARRQVRSPQPPDALSLIGGGRDVRAPPAYARSTRCRRSQSRIIQEKGFSGSGATPMIQVLSGPSGLAII